MTVLRILPSLGVLQGKTHVCVSGLITRLQIFSVTVAQELLFYQSTHSTGVFLTRGGRQRGAQEIQELIKFSVAVTHRVFSVLLSSFFFFLLSLAKIKDILEQIC